MSRIELIKSKTANDNSHFVQANAYLQQLQTEVTQGAADPLRLSLAGLGEQAYILLHQGQAQIEVTREEYEPPKIDVALNPATLDKIIELYATQSAEGDSSGYDSLLMLSRTLMAKIS